MHSFAVWLMQYRHRQWLMMVALFLLPATQLPAAAIAVASTLSLGVVAVAPLMAAASVVIGGLYWVLAGAGAAWQILLLTAGLLVAAVSVGGLLRYTRSLTLSLQLSVIVMVIAIAWAMLVIGDPLPFWREAVAAYLQQLAVAGVPLAQVEAEQVETLVAAIAPFATGIVAASFWFALAAVLLGGYFLWDAGSRELKAEFGRFRDLNFGRTLAVMLLLLALLSSVLKALILLNIALAMLLAFALHGSAILHWLRHRYQWSAAVLVVAYGLMVIPTPLSGVAVVLVCVAGYVDAWFNILRVKPAGEGR